jgi:hypothetical protein
MTADKIIVTIDFEASSAAVALRQNGSHATRTAFLVLLPRSRRPTANAPMSRLMKRTLAARQAPYFLRFRYQRVICRSLRSNRRSTRKSTYQGRLADQRLRIGMAAMTEAKSEKSFC